MKMVGGTKWRPLESSIFQAAEICKTAKTPTECQAAYPLKGQICHLVASVARVTSGELTRIHIKRLLVTASPHGACFQLCCYLYEAPSIAIE